MTKKRVTVRVANDERPGPLSKFKASYIPIAGNLAKRGMIDAEIAAILGVTIRTFRRWLATNEALRAVMVRDKPVADARVELSLYETAIGYDYYEEEVKVVEGQVVKVSVLRHKPGETAACINWLANRTEWRRNPDNVEAPPAATDTGPIDITPENARQIARKVALVIFKGGKAS